MPSISPPFSASPLSIMPHLQQPPDDPVDLILQLIEIYDSLIDHIDSRVQFRLQIVDELKARGIPIIVNDDNRQCPNEKTTKYRRVVKIGSAFVFSSPGKTVKDTVKGTGRALLHFINCIKVLVKQIKLESQSTDDPIELLATLSQKCSKNFIKIQLTGTVYTVLAFEKRALTVIGDSQEDAAKKLVEQLGRLAGIEGQLLKKSPSASVSNSPESVNSQVVKCMGSLDYGTFEKTLVDCYHSVQHLPTKRSIFDSLLIKYPDIFKLTEATIAGKFTPVVTLQDGSTFLCDNEVGGNCASERDVIGQKLIVFLKNKAAKLAKQEQPLIENSNDHISESCSSSGISELSTDGSETMTHASSSSTISSPELSHPLPTSAADVTFLLNLLQTFETIQLPVSNVQTRIQIAVLLSTRDLPIEIFNTTKTCSITQKPLYSRIVKLNGYIDFTATAKCVKDTLKSTGTGILQFIDNLKALIMHFKDVYNPSLNPFEMLQLLHERCYPSNVIVVLIDSTVTISITGKTTLSVTESTPNDAATKMIQQLKQLANINCTELLVTSPTTSGTSQTPNQHVQKRKATLPKDLNLLLFLLSAFDSLPQFSSKSLMRSQIIHELQQRGFHIEVVDEILPNVPENGAKYTRTITIGENIVYSSSAKTRQDAFKCAGASVLYFVESLQSLIVQFTAVYKSTKSTLALFDILNEKCFPNFLKFHKTSNSVYMTINSKTVLTSTGKSYHAAAFKMIGYLKQLAKFENSDSAQVDSITNSMFGLKLEPEQPKQVEEFENDELDQILVECYQSVHHIINRVETLNYLCTQFPAVFQYTEFPPIGPEVTLPNGAKFNCLDSPRYEFTSRKDVVAHKLLIFLRNKAIRANPSSSNEFESESPNFSSGITSPEIENGQNSTEYAESINFLQNLMQSPETVESTIVPNEVSECPKPELIRAQSTPPANPTVASLEMPFFYLSDEKIAKRRQLIDDYNAVYSTDKTNCEVIHELMMSGKTKFDLTTKPHTTTGKYNTQVRIQDICLIEAIASTEVQSCEDVLQKTFSFIQNVANLVDSFKSIYSPTKSPTEIITKLLAENSEIMKLYNTTKKHNLYCTTINIFSLAAFIGKPNPSKKQSELIAYVRVLEYMKKLAKIEDNSGVETKKEERELMKIPMSEVEPFQAFKPDLGFENQSNSGSVSMPIFDFEPKPVQGTSPKPTINWPAPPKIPPNMTINSDQERFNLLKLSDNRLENPITIKARKLQQLLRQYFSLPLTAQVNMFKIIENVNFYGEILQITEYSNTCPLKNIPVYTVELDYSDIFNFKSSAYKKRDALGMVGLKLIQLIGQLKELLMFFKYVNTAESQPLHIIKQLQVKFSNSVISIYDGWIELENILLLTGPNPDDLAHHMVQFLVDLSEEIPSDIKYPVKMVEELASLIHCFDKTNSTKSLGILQEMRESGEEIAIFSNYLHDLSLSTIGHYRSIVLFENIALFESIDADQAVSRSSSEAKAIAFLANLSHLMANFSAESLLTTQHLELFCSLLGKNSQIIEVHHSVEQPQICVATVELLDVFTFTGNGNSKLEAIYAVAEKFVDFLKMLNVKLGVLVKESQDPSKQHEQFCKSLIRRYKSVSEYPESEILQTLERLRGKGVFIETTFATEPEGDFRCSLAIGRTGKFVFHAKAGTKINAKREAAKNLCKYLNLLSGQSEIPSYQAGVALENLSEMPNESLAVKLSHLPEIPKDLNKASHLLDNKTSRAIYKTVVKKWKSLPLENHRCKVLAAFVVTSELNSNDIRVLSIGTGSKIILSESIALNGKVIHDSHAEIIARRALICLLYENLQELVGNGLKDRPELVLEPVLSKSSRQQGFRFKPHLKLHLYVTSPPCGASFKVLDNKLRVKKEALAGYYEMEDTYISNFVKFKKANKNLLLWLALTRSPCGMRLVFRVHYSAPSSSLCI